MALAGHLQQDLTGFIDDPLGVLAGLDDPEEARKESGRPEGELSGVRVDVEQAALGARARRDFRLVDRRGNPVDV